MKIGIATCVVLPEPDPDEALTLAAFRTRGHRAEMIAWDDPEADPSKFDVVILRSTWNYPEVPFEFAEWIDFCATQTTLLNSAEIVRWNLNKRYLIELERRGIPIVPTRFMRAGDNVELTEKCVIKPVIGAGSMDTRAFEADQTAEALEWLSTMHPDREFMVQPYFESVHHEGEQSIAIIGDTPTHRVRKRPRFSGDDEFIEGPLPVSPEFFALARMTIEPFIGRLLYGRVDFMLDPSGAWRVSELELIEPSLYFLQYPTALELLVDRVEAMA